MAELRVHARDTALVLVDVQARLAAAMPVEAFAAMTRNIVTLIATAARLNLPVLVSEQYPNGLGRTIPVLNEAVGKLQPAALYLEKNTFSLADEPLFQTFLGHGKRTLVMVGMEAHICVYQSARALAQRGYSVHVPVDAVISRTEANHRVGLDLIARAGCIPTSTETVLFDLLERAGTEAFKLLSRLVK
ncbi:MAG: isochorismatase family protein [Polyangia bacterium]